MSDNSTTAYSAPPIDDPFYGVPRIPPDVLSGGSNKTYFEVPPRPFDFNTTEYWSWWMGYLAGNNCTADQMLRAIEEDREAE